MKQNYHGSSLKHKILFWFLGICLLSLILMLLITQIFFGKVIMDNFKDISKEATKRLYYHLDYYFSQFSKSTQTLISNSNIQDFLVSNKNYSLQELQDIEKELRRYVVFNYSEAINVILVSNDLRVVSMDNSLDNIDGRSFVNEPWYNSDMPNTPIVLPTHRAGYTKWRGYPVMSMVIPVYNINTIEIAGKLVVDFGLDEIIKTFEDAKIKDTGLFFILSPDNQIVYHPNKELLGLNLRQTELADLNSAYNNETYIMKIAGKKSLVSMSQMGTYKWRLVFVMDYSEMNGPLMAAQHATITAFLIISLILLIIIPFVTESITKPIIRIKELMGRVTKGDLSVRAEKVESTDEFNQLSCSFNSMVEQLSELMKTVSDLKIREMTLVLRQKEAIIKFFQNQINPHLLYNSLDIIKSMAYLEHIPQIVTMTTNLADVYRYNAKFSDSEVTIFDEIKYLEKYLEIIKVRFPRKFKSVISISNAHYNCLCLKLILQPITENAVKYAVEPEGGKGSIQVSSFLDGSDLVIKIADDGPGIPEEKLTSLQKQWDYISNNVIQNHKEDNSQGLSNVHTRLVLKYGNSYGLSIKSIKGSSTTVIIRIPFREKQ